MSDLTVLLNDTVVGTLTKLTSGTLQFRYSEQWLQQSGARPISLSMPLKQCAFEGDVVYNFFDNLLPDSYQVKARIQTRFKAKTSQPFDLLEHIGRDCVGAIQLSLNPTLEPQPLRAEPLDKKKIANILRHHQDSPLGMTVDCQDFRLSIAGVQEKAAFLWYQNQWQRPLGRTPTSHIFKLPIGFIRHQHLDLTESCENEWLCSEIAQAFGLPVAHTYIEQFEEVKVLIVERFDRKWMQNNCNLIRLPQEDLCQALGISPNLKYEADGGPGVLNVMEFLLGSSHPTQDREMFFRSQILFYLLAAIDGHAKNFSVFIESNGTYRLTPLYDILSAYPMLANRQLERQKLKMAMAFVGRNKHYRWNNIYRRHFISTAEAAKFSVLETEAMLQDMLNRVDSVIATVKTRLPKQFPQHIAENIFSGMLAARKKIS